MAVPGMPGAQMPQQGMTSQAPTGTMTAEEMAVMQMKDAKAVMEYLFGHDLKFELDAGLEETEVGEVFVAAPIRVEYIEDNVTAGEPRTIIEEVPPVILDLLPFRTEEIVPNTLLFTWGGTQFRDGGDGKIYRGEDTQAGDIDYTEGTVELYNAGTSGTATVQVDRMLTTAETPGVETLFFRLPGSPVRPGTTSIMATTMSGEEIVRTVDDDGGLRGDLLAGAIDQQNGIVRMAFQETVPFEQIDQDDPPNWFHNGLVIETAEGTYVRRPIRCQPQDIRFSTVIIDYLPLEADVLGLDPVRLPQDGRVPITRPGDVVVFSDTQTDELTTGVAAGNSYTLSRDDLGYIELRDQEDVQVSPAMYTTDLHTGTVTITDSWNGTEYIEPLKAIHRKEEMKMVAEVEVTGRVQVTPEMKRGFPAGTQISSALIVGDLHARVPLFFEQVTWQDQWHNERQGDRPTGSYDRVNYPVEITNQDSIDERWAIHFTSETEFEVIGERLGVVASGTINTDVAPINPATNQPYFTLRSEGFGTGWGPGNAIRWNTKAAHYPLWLLRCVQQGESDVRDDHFTLQLRGDAQ